MQNIADIGFELLLETGLAASGDTKTLQAWRAIGNEQPSVLAKRIGEKWMDYLMTPEINENIDNSISYIEKHNEFLLLKIQEKFGGLETFQEISEASILMIALALHLSRGLGADTKGICEHWIAIAKNNGAKE